MKWKHTIIIAASITLIGTAAYAVVPILAKSIQWTTSSSTPCAAGTSCMWAKTSDGLPYWHKTDNTNTALIGGGGTVSADSPLTGDGSGGSHLACATCVVTGGSTFVGANTFSGTQLGTYSLGGTPSLAAALSLGGNALQDSTSVILKSTHADGAGAVAAIVDTSSAWSTSGSKLLSLRTNNVEKLYIDEAALGYPSVTTPGTSIYMGATGLNGMLIQASVFYVFTGGNPRAIIDGNGVLPGSDGGAHLGGASKHWDYATLGAAVGSQPTCDSTTRGTVMPVFGGGGVADLLQWCGKNVAGSYSWQTVFTAL